jgi:hypothetical protein
VLARHLVASWTHLVSTSSQRGCHAQERMLATRKRSMAGCYQCWLDQHKAAAARCSCGLLHHMGTAASCVTVVWMKASLCFRTSALEWLHLDVTLALVAFVGSHVHSQTNYRKQENHGHQPVRARQRRPPTRGARPSSAPCTNLAPSASFLPKSGSAGTASSWGLTLVSCAWGKMVHAKSVVAMTLLSTTAAQLEEAFAA